MKKSKIKHAIIFSILTLSMLFYLGSVFYLSEPKYIDNCKQELQRYDYVSIPEYSFGNDIKKEVINGIVLQVDKEKALLKCKKYFMSSDYFYELDFKKSEYRIIGKGTIYHKVNDYVGFNIMIISQFIIGILLAIVIISLVTTLKELLLS